MVSREDVRDIGVWRDGGCEEQDVKERIGMGRG